MIRSACLCPALGLNFQVLNMDLVGGESRADQKFEMPAFGSMKLQKLNDLIPLQRSGGEGAEGGGRVQVRDVRPLAVHVPAGEGIRGGGRGARAERGRREGPRRRIRLRHAVCDVIRAR